MEFTNDEREDILEAWNFAGTVEGTRHALARLQEKDKPVSWDTMRRWLDRLGIREDPTK